MKYDNHYSAGLNYGGHAHHDSHGQHSKSIRYGSWGYGRWNYGGWGGHNHHYHFSGDSFPYSLYLSGVLSPRYYYSPFFGSHRYYGYWGGYRPHYYGYYY